MRGMPFNNSAISQFFEGAGTYSGGGGSNLGRMRKRGMGSIGASSSSSGPGATSSVPTAGSPITTDGLSSTVNSIGTLATSATNLAKGILQAEAAQNAINAQKNLVSALTPGVITIGLGLLAYVLVTKRK